tara:strand:+ start:221 stop:1045 length:825 start_codon:yes stop_codon:yes gene_type:complete
MMKNSNMEAIEEYKNFWKLYSPYKLHPKDEKQISKQKNKDELVIKLCVEDLIKKYGNLKNKTNNADFQMNINPNAIHSNMYCKSFIGNPETAKVIILYGNPGLELGDYQDEHKDKEYIKILNNDIRFHSDGFLFLNDLSKRTGGYNYWSNEGRLNTVIEGLSLKKGFSKEKAIEKLKESLCLLQSVGYHSPKLPTIKPESLPSSLMTRKLVHEYLLPKAKRNEIFIFSWRQTKFWELEEGKNIMIRDRRKAQNGRFLKTTNEAERITEFLLEIL